MVGKQTHYNVVQLFGGNERVQPIVASLEILLGNLKDKECCDRSAPYFVQVHEIVFRGDIDLAEIITLLFHFLLTIADLAWVSFIEQSIEDNRGHGPRASVPHTITSVSLSKAALVKSAVCFH